MSEGSNLSPQEKAILKLILKGQSIIDWPRLRFSTEEEVRHFLKINEFDLKKPKDLDRLTEIHNEAIGYLRRELKFSLDPEIAKPDRIPDLFLIASGEKRGKPAKQACALLKVMNIVHHIDGRELLTNCPISLRDLFSLVEDKVERALSSLTRVDSLVLKYQGGRKPKESLITKLLCKRATIAAQIYDRVRYRIVTKKKEDIVAVVLRLFETILPFNYVIPEASVNHLIRLDLKDRAHLLREGLARRLHPVDLMEYSGATYKVCKFVVDIPIRMDNFLASSSGYPYRESLGSISYVLVEFQIVDEETESLNNVGRNSHENYKKRQKRGVVRRLVG